MCNEQSFTPEEVKSGELQDLLDYLISRNQKSNKGYYEILITSDGYSTIVQWYDKLYEDTDDEGFKFVKYDEVVMKELILPDNSVEYCFDEEDKKEKLDNWLKEHTDYIWNENLHTYVQKTDLI